MPFKRLTWQRIGYQNWVNPLHHLLDGSVLNAILVTDVTGVLLQEGVSGHLLPLTIVKKRYSHNRNENF